MTEPEVWDRFPVSVPLSLGDMCLLHHAIGVQLRDSQAATLSDDAGEREHAALRVKWYGDILTSIKAASREGEARYHAAWDEYERASNGEPDHEPAAESE
jgi:hypothetical protein